jgi:acetyltransferase-like isoleucine patch superfamily enzyme
MKAYILPSHVTIDPFGDEVGESYVGNRTLDEHQKMVLEKAGLQVEAINSIDQIDQAEFLLVYDDVFFTSRVMDAFVKTAKKEKRSLHLGLPADSLFVKRTQSLQDIEFDQDQNLILYRIYYIHTATPPKVQAEFEESLQQAAPTRARFKEKIWNEPAPKHITGFEQYEHPITSSVIIHCRHWIHILWANQFSVQIKWVETILGHKLWTLGKLLLATLLALLSGKWSRAGFKWLFFSRFNRMGKNCEIHPTARVELSQLGDNVKVGAYALVRGCVIGDNVTIEDRANVYFSVVGHDCFISKNSTMVFCAGYPDSDLCVNGIQGCLFGRRCALTSRVWVIDIKATGKTRVMHKGKLREVDAKVLGACFGHGCFAGMDITIGQGREIPNGAVLIRPPSEILRKIPPDLPPGVPAWVRDGTAVTEE